MGNAEISAKITRVLQERGLLPVQPRLRYWETKDGWQFLYTVEKVEDDQGRDRYQSAIYQPKGPGSQSGPKAWTRRTRLVLRRAKSHSTRKAAKARAYRLYTDHKHEIEGRKIMRAQRAQEGATS